MPILHDDVYTERAFIHCHQTVINYAVQRWHTQALSALLEPIYVHYSSLQARRASKSYYRPLHTNHRNMCIPSAWFHPCPLPTLHQPLFTHIQRSRDRQQHHIDVLSTNKQYIYIHVTNIKYIEFCV